MYPLFLAGACLDLTWFRLPKSSNSRYCETVSFPGIAIQQRQSKDAFRRLEGKVNTHAQHVTDRFEELQKETLGM